MAQARARSGPVVAAYIPVTVIGGVGSDTGYQQRAVIFVVLLVACGVGQAATGDGDWQPETDGCGTLRRIDTIGLYRKPVEGIVVFRKEFAGCNRNRLGSTWWSP